MGLGRDRVKRTWIAIAILVGTVVACAGPRQTRAAHGERLGPTVILVSLDGFRWDYLGRTPTPNLDRLMARGVRARWMVPVVPTVTFPNHYSIVTGLYPEHHGIVGNRMVDPADGARFLYSDSSSAWQTRWWGGEPLWNTATRQGRRSATYFWPGSDVEIAGLRPTYWKKFDQRVPGGERVAEVLRWLDLPDSQRPAFLTLYFREVDHFGHENGPESPEVLLAVRTVDSLVGLLVSGLKARGLSDMVNLIVVSDHGMAQTSPERVVFLDDSFDPAAVDQVSLGPFVSLRSRTGRSEPLARALVNAGPHVRFYRRAETPARWHYRDNPRITDVVGVAEDGWTFTTRDWYARNRQRLLGGSHGYDNADPAMRAIFIAAGPAFQRGLVVEPFQNVHVYELICAVLGLRPAPNDGSLDSVRVMLRR